MGCVNLRCLLQRAALPTLRSKGVSPYAQRKQQSAPEIQELSQQDLADKLNVVWQTILKWEQGLSVPDSDLLIALSKALETPMSTLLWETVAETEADTASVVS